MITFIIIVSIADDIFVDDIFIIAFLIARGLK